MDAVVQVGMTYISAAQHRTVYNSRVHLTTAFCHCTIMSGKKLSGAGMHLNGAVTGYTGLHAFTLTLLLLVHHV